MIINDHLFSDEITAEENSRLFVGDHARKGHHWDECICNRTLYGAGIAYGIQIVDG